MPRWAELQRAFAGAVLRPEAALPDATAATAGRPSTRRFNVYRNNVAASLTGALGATFPVVAALVGANNFSVLARGYVSATPPQSPVLADYGGTFPDFIAAHEAGRTIAYLADVARLEWAWLCAYHAADAAPVPIGALAALGEDELPGAHLTLHPSARLVTSRWPVVSIWQAHQGDDPQRALRTLADRGEDALVARPALSVEVRRLAPGVAAFAAALASGAPFAAAAEAGAAQSGAFDLAAALRNLFEAGAIVAVGTG